MRNVRLVAGIVLLAASPLALAANIKNWNAPSTWSPSQATPGSRSPLVTGNPPLPFVPVTPCRVADTRAGSGFSGAYGSPSIAGGGSRIFTITGQCGIPAGAAAVSFNFTVWNTTSYGDFKIYPTGASVAPVSTLNWGPGVLMLANAAIVPLGTGGSAGQITVVNEGTGTVDLIFDVNGYYASTQPTATTFTISTPGVYGIFGVSTNTSVGVGVTGLAQSATTGYGVYGGGSTYGVYGTGTTYGTYGASSAGVGAYGTSSSAQGVYGKSTNLNGVWAESTNQDGLFAAGGRDGAYITGARHGLQGVSTGTGSVLYGVYGQSASTTAGSSGGYFTDTSGGPSGIGSYYFNTIGAIGASKTIGLLGIVGNSYAGVGGVSLSNTTPFAMQAAGWLGWSNSTAGYFQGNVTVTSSPGGAGNLFVAGTLSKGAGSFKIDHPLDPENKYLYHSFVESPDMKNVYDGIVSLDDAGEAVVTLPAYFEALNSDFRYQLTCIGRHAPVFIADEIAGNSFRVAGGRPGMKVSWQVTGIRKDPFANANRIIPEVEKEPEARGYYLHPDAYKQPVEKSLTDHLAKVQKEEAAAEQARADRNNH